MKPRITVTGIWLGFIAAAAMWLATIYLQEIRTPFTLGAYTFASYWLSRYDDGYAVTPTGVFFGLFFGLAILSSTENLAWTLLAFSFVTGLVSVAFRHKNRKDKK